MAELLDIYDGNKKNTGRTAERGVYEFKDGEYHLVVQAIILNTKNEILISKRAPFKKFGGMWECNGGSILTGETSLEGIIRELKEELGINLEESMNVVKVTQQGVPLGFESSKKIKNFFITFYCLKRNSSKIEIQKEEIDKYVWLPLEETFQLLKCGRTKFPKNFDYSDIFEKVRNIYYSQSKGNTQREE